ncbi:MAG: type II secretion system F family protein [Candidatus Wallbacteria bacterium]|nr:type II secretion system F family protein [Candidatus Wallbacteria bacterium]
MADFIYEGTNKNGVTIQGRLEALNKEEIKKILDRQGISPTKIKPCPELTLKEMLTSGSFSISTKDIFLFTKYFAIVLKAGIPVIKGLSILRDQTVNLRFRRRLSKIIAKVESGSSLHQAFELFPDIFTPMYCSLLKVGEESGLLYEMVLRLAKYMEKANTLKRKVKGAMMYPAVIMSVAFCIVCFLLTFVIPRFAKMFQSFGADLPMPTRILIAVSDFFKAHIVLILLVIGAAIFTFRYLSKTAAGKYFLDGLVLKLPVVGTLALKSAINDITKNLAVLLRSGIPISRALEITVSAIDNIIIKNQIITVKVDIEAGVGISPAFKRASCIPFMVSEMINVGDTTGTLEAMLDNISEFYEEEVDNLVNNMTALVEPLFIVFLGGVVGSIVISMFLPIFKISSAVMKSTQQ